MTEMVEKIVKNLLDIGTVSLNPNKPSTWASDIESPIYCDNRTTMSYPVVRKEIVEGLVAKAKETFPEVEVITETATIRIPHAVWVVDILGLPMVYTRGKVKDHDKGNQIEGRTSGG